MYYEAATIETKFMQPVMVEDVKQNPEIRKTRFILLILVSIELAITIIHSVLVIFTVKSHNSALDGKDSAMVYMGFVIFFLSAALIYYIIFIAVVIKYKRIGILIFAWLNVIGQIIYVVLLFITFAATVANSSSTINRKFEATYTVVYLIAYSIDVLLSVLTIFFAFKLAKLIKRSTTNQIV